MRRTITIAQTEFLGLVRSRFFLISILIVPVFVMAASAFIGFVERRVDRDDRRFAVADATGVLYEAIAQAAREPGGGEAAGGETRPAARFLPERENIDGRSRDLVTLGLSERVRSGDLFAFVYIPANVLEPESDAAIEYYSQNTAYGRLSSWLSRHLSRAIRQQRLARAGLDAGEIERLVAATPLSSFDLVERQADGTIAAARKVDGIQQFGMPVFLLVVMFMAIMSSAQHLINSTIEEKVSKISEVLLGSVSAFELLAGKLLGIVAVSFVLALVYLAGGAYTLLNIGRPDLINLPLAGWFLLFLLTAALLYGSLFQALSAACSDLKDAQSLLQPAMMVLMVGYFASFVVLRAPDSTVAAGLSMVPLMSPFAMMLRLAVPPGPPLWQLILSVGLLAAVTTATVWVAGRIFRVGLLMQGKQPTLPELLRWIRH
jgi:ABC-2 type transport system permease protein